MSDVSTNEDDRFAEHADRSGTGNENVVHPAQFHVDLQAEIRESLRRGLVDILRLDALSGQTDQGVSHAFHFRVDRGLARENHHDQLKAVVSGLEKAKHRLDLLDARGVFAEARLTDDGHAGIVGDSLQLLSECSGEEKRFSAAAAAVVRRVTYRSDASLQFRCGAKQAMAQVRISMPVWNCLPRMSQTPWLGVTITFACEAV